jgi:hypothetical protein
LVVVSLANFAFCDREARAGGESAYGGRLHGTFEMKVQLRFGKEEDALRKHGRMGLQSQ